MGDSAIRGGNRRRVQVRAERKDGFTAAKRQRFLDHLAGCCNLKRAAEAAGITPETVNYHRRRDPAFKAACQEALDAGYLALEAMMIERAAGAGYTPGPDAEAAPGPETLDTPMAQFLMGLRAREMGRRTGDTSGHRPRSATEKELNDAIMAKLAILDASLRTGRSKLSGGKPSGGKRAGAKAGGGKRVAKKAGARKPGAEKGA